MAWPKGVPRPLTMGKKKAAPPAQPSAVDDTEAQVTDRQRAIWEQSLAVFAAEALQGPPEAPYNGRFLIYDHHEEWAEMIEENDRVCILAPRDHGKSRLCSHAYAIWRAYFNPGERLYIFSATQEQAIKILTDIKDEIEDNPKLRHLLPDPKKRNRAWNAQSIRLSNGFRIFCRGFGTKVRGAHPKFIVIDDGLNDEDATSETVRKRHISYFFSAITNLCIPGGQIVVVGTPFAHQDLYGELSRRVTYTFRRYKAVAKDGTILWPDRYSQARLKLKLDEIGGVLFAREFLCEPVDDGSSMFPDDLFRGAGVEDFTIRLGMPLEYWRAAGIKSIFLGVDLAISASTGADYTVVWVVGLGPHGTRWIIDVERAKGMPYHVQLSLIERVARKYDADLVYIEANQMQRVFGDELIRTSDLPIKKFVTTGTGKQKKGIPTGDTMTQNKNSMTGGIPSLRVMLENKKYRIPMGDERSREMMELWIAELHSFVWQDGKLTSVSDHDDVGMASWIGEQAVKMGGFSFSTGFEEEFQHRPAGPVPAAAVPAPPAPPPPPAVVHQDTVPEVKAKRKAPPKAFVLSPPPEELPAPAEGGIVASFIKPPELEAREAQQQQAPQPGQQPTRPWQPTSFWTVPGSR